MNEGVDTYSDTDADADLHSYAHTKTFSHE